MKTACIYHSVDLDGWMSAAIVKLAHENIVKERSEFRQEDMSKVHIIDFIGYNHYQSIPDLSGYNQVIMCDISFPKEEMDKLHWKLRENFIWLDHHISVIKDSLDFSYSRCEGLRITAFAACELTWKYFFPDEPMPEIVRLLGRYDCFGHKGTSEEKKVLEFQYGARSVISSYQQAYEWLIAKEYLHSNGEVDSIVDFIWKKGVSIYQYLCTDAILSYKHGFEITLYQPIKGVGSVARKFIAINRERLNPINFDIDYHAEGYDGCACFWYEGKSKLWKFSLYNDNGQVDCSAIAQQFGGGGHKGAAGFATEDLYRIIKY